jgi:hypothetical protein
MNLHKYFDDFIITSCDMTEDDDLYREDYDLFHGPLANVDFLQEDLEEFLDECDSLSD